MDLAILPDLKPFDAKTKPLSSLQHFPLAAAK